MRNSKQWPPARVEELKRLRIDEQKSYSEISEEMNITIGQVAGAVRTYISLKKKRSDAPRQAYTKKEMKTESQRLGDLTAKEILEKIVSNSIAYPDPRFMSNGYCRAVIGSPKDLICCGARTKMGAVYCKAHHDEYTEGLRGTRSFEKFQ